MASTVNKITLIGYVGKDPEIFKSNSGLTVASFSVATKDKIKEQKVDTWHNCTAFDKLAEIVQKYVKKGAKIYCEGKIQYQQYSDKNGEKKNTTKIIINEVSLLSNPLQSGYQHQAGTPTQGHGWLTQDQQDIPF